MLKLIHIVKNYVSGDETVQALKSVDVEFRRNEFVSILGPSGCGKTTLLNIIGGLDRYTSGDIVIDGRSTKEYSDSEWDSYRNHSIGFVFQSYNLIPHQTVLANVELALTLSGVPKAERRKRATQALIQVGLGDKLKKRPNQLSGGQMQRVAIARAIVNDPEILLADEPTGALDSETSVQVMELLKEIAKDKLVIMVTHNPELAERYSTRIVRMLDGRMVGDSAPYEGNDAADVAAVKAEAERAKEKKGARRRDARTGKTGKTSMSFWTALSLSLNNLMTKKGRTVMTSFAGSIGIIGIALILALSNGIQTYIDRVQEETLSAYPITIQKESVNMGSLIADLSSTKENRTDHTGEDKVYSNVILYEFLDKLTNYESKINNMAAFAAFLESGKSNIMDYVSAVKYGYDLDLNVYAFDKNKNVIAINPSTLLESMRGSGMASSPFSSMMTGSGSSFVVWEEMLPGKNNEPISSMMHEQYDILAGRWPTEKNEIVMFVNSNNEISDITLYTLGFKDQAEFRKMMAEYYASGKVPSTQADSWDFNDILGKTYKLVLPTEYFRFDESTGTYRDVRTDENADIYLTEIVEKAMDLKIVGIARPNPDAVSTVMRGTIGYTKELTDSYIDSILQSAVVKYQQAHEDTDIFTGNKFAANLTETEKAERAKNYVAGLSVEKKAEIYRKILAEQQVGQYTEQIMKNFNGREDMLAAIRKMFESSGYSESQIEEYMEAMESYSDEVLYSRVEMLVKAAVTETVNKQLKARPDNELATEFDTVYLPALDESGYAALLDYVPAESTLKENYQKLGVVDKKSPSSISIYASTFEAKDKINTIIDDYNRQADENDKIDYTDYVALIMSSISQIIGGISIVLIAFVSISLVVSSIMIGIITYISVLERTKEIGILRAVGASKSDVTRVFNAETLIIGFGAGTFGILITYLLCLPINLIVRALTDIDNLGAIMPWQGSVILVLISMALTLISGLIPSLMAAKKDPVTALRTE